MLFAQSGEWTWIHGNNLPNQNGAYGTQGVPDPANTPPSLYEPVQWTDLSGNFWLFGGNKNITDHFNDLWKYNVATNEWTWVNGPGVSNQSGIYGIQGVSSPANIPGAHCLGAVSWTDNSGNLWLWGGNGIDGSGNGNLNDLWKYDINTNEWTWMKGANTVNQNGVYGIKGVSDPNTTPGARNETAAEWVDNSGNLWLFGGKSSSGRHNDLWMYNISTNEWTWMSGDNLPDQSGVYGLKGVSGPTNIPGGRQIYSTWKDTNGNFWMFGGYGVDGLGNTGVLNDLWMYNISTNEWTWISGTNTKDDTGNYGVQCTPSVLNIPPARYETRACWVDSTDNFWFFGGQRNNDFYNDLWNYNISSNEWTWVSGDSTLNQSSVYGTKGVSNASNKCGARSGAVSWQENNNLWLFGGLSTSSSFLNDLWKYTIDPNCSGNVTSITKIRSTFSFQIIPNPLKETATIKFEIDKPTQVVINVFNSLGKKVASIMNERKSQGTYEVEFIPNQYGLVKGIYLLSAQLDNQLSTKRFVIMK